MHDIAIGCAGWAIPRQHQALFGEGDSVLARYATRFSVTEINSSFYRNHRLATYARWAATVPRHFQFSVKLPKAISHELALRGAGQALDMFLGDVAGLEEKLGRVLLQLPPSHRLDLRTASTFFRMFRRRSDTPLVCEPRHASWFSPQADALFTHHGVSRVIADPPISKAGAHPSADPARPYWRMHGTPRMYYSDYSDGALQNLAHEVSRHGTSSSSTWVIFDNTAHGFAGANAARLLELLKAHS